MPQGGWRWLSGPGPSARTDRRYTFHRYWISSITITHSPSKGPSASLREMLEELGSACWYCASKAACVMMAAAQLEAVMLTWNIGDVTIKRVVEMELPVPYSEKHSFLKQATPDALKEMPWLSPHFVTSDGALMLSIHALLVEAPGFKLIVDTCVGNDKPRFLTRKQALQTKFLDQLAEAGFPRESVNAVVCTHLHVDHVGWNTMLVDGKWVPTFPNARYLIGKTEYEHWSKETEGETAAIMADSVSPIFEYGLAETVEMDHRISSEIRLLPTPGHTPGHVSVVIESKGQTAIITGDMMHHPCQVSRPDWVSEFDNDKSAGAERRNTMIREWADKPYLIIGTHFAAPTAGHIRSHGKGHRFEA